MDNKQVDIVIIGAGLTGLTLAFYLKKAGKNFIVLEKNEDVGGVINSTTENGFTYEKGPSTGVIASEELVELFDDLGNDCSLELTNPEAEERWILKDSRWVPLPSGLKQAISTPLFTWYDKFRILGEPWRKKGNNPDETLADMVKRRLGKSYLHYAVDPFISGIYAGDPSKLVTKYAMPKLYQLEQNYGSFIKGAIKKKKEPKTELQKRVNRKVFSVKGGLKNLIVALKNNVGYENIICDCRNIEIDRANSSFKVICNSKKIHINTNNVVTTVGGYALPKLLPFINNGVIQKISTIPYAKVSQVVVGYNNWRGISLKAFGGLVPFKEKRDILGVLFTGSLFKGRCPEGGALLSMFVGGMKKPELINKTDEEIKSLVVSEIKSILKHDGQPDLFKIHRYNTAIPQYDGTSKNRVEAIEQIQNEFSGLILGGNISDGIGMADRVKQAKDIFKSLTNN